MHTLVLEVVQVVLVQGKACTWPAWALILLAQVVVVDASAWASLKQILQVVVELLVELNVDELVLSV